MRSRLALPARADAVADFYKGKQISVIIGTSAGNDYDFRARLLARHMGRFIPGEPTLVPRNMPGAGGINAANRLANVAPHDGTAIHLIMANMMNKQAVGVPGIKFDARKFSWIGNTTSTPNVTSSWHTSGVTRIEQVKERELIIGAPAGTAGEVYGAVMNALVGTKFKVVTGYPGGNEVNLAMERGEIQGRASNSWASWKSTRPDWVRDKKLIVLVQVALKRDPDLAGRADTDRSRQQRARQDVHGVPVGRDRGRPRAGGAAGRAGGPPQCAAPRLRQDRARSAIPRRGRQDAAWTSSR